MTIQWSVDLQVGVSGAPVNDGDRVYLALRNAQLAAMSLADGHELWRIPKDVNAPMAAAGGLVFISAADAIEAVRGADGASAWIAPRLKATVPLAVAGGLVIAVTEGEIVAIRAADGQIAWRRQAGGVQVSPAFDGDRLFVGANDGRVVALTAASGEVLWEKYVDGGVTSLAASRGLVYAGGGDKQFICLDARNGGGKWSRRIGSIAAGAIAVDDEHVYFTAFDNVVRGLDRQNGAQRWQTPLSKRPVGGVRLAGLLLILQVHGNQIVMLLDRNGLPSGTIGLPGETTRDTPPAARETPNGINVVAVTGGLSNKWQVTLIGPGSELALEPFAQMMTTPLGVVFLTDPQLTPMGRVLPWLLLGDPILKPFSVIEWPVVLRDPPLEPLTTLPGLQLRPLSPVLPARRGA